MIDRASPDAKPAGTSTDIDNSCHEAIGSERPQSPLTPHVAGGFLIA